MNTELLFPCMVGKNIKMFLVQMITYYSLSKKRDGYTISIMDIQITCGRFIEKSVRSLVQLQNILRVACTT